MTGEYAAQKERQRLDAVERLDQARRALSVARQEYRSAIVYARREIGMSNQAIGTALGITEAAVRMFIRRNWPGGWNG